jgi:putative transposase
MRTHLVRPALAMAVARRCELADEVILHADRGCTVRLGAVRAVRPRAQSGALSWPLRQILWPAKAAAKLAVGEWIERVYNQRRRHLAVGMISPVDFEDRPLRQHKP